MINIFQSMFKTRVSPNSEVKKSFCNQFQNPINIEWTKRGHDYEAIFYLENIECIAMFDERGIMVSLKKNLSLEDVPKPIADCAMGQGEVMNVVFIEENKNQLYEVIVRDSELVRSVVYISSQAEVIDRKVL